MYIYIYIPSGYLTSPWKITIFKFGKPSINGPSIPWLWRTIPGCDPERFGAGWLPANLRRWAASKESGQALRGCPSVLGASHTLHRGV